MVNDRFVSVARSTSWSVRSLQPVHGLQRYPDNAKTRIIFMKLCWIYGRV